MNYDHIHRSSLMLFTAPSLIPGWDCLLSCQWRDSTGRLPDQAGGRKVSEMGKVNTSKGTMTVDEIDALMWCKVMKT